MRRRRDRRSRFGPNADDVLDLLEQLDRLSTADVLGLAAAGAALTGERGPGEPADTRPDPRLVAARRRVRTLAETHGRLAALRSVGDEIADWAASLVHWFPAGIAGGSEARSEIPPRLAALPVVLDAAYATVMEDLLTEEEADLLCAAWDEGVPDAGDDAGDDAGPDDGAGPEGGVELDAGESTPAEDAPAEDTPTERETGSS
jgi:hypothetical protein